MMRYIKDTLKVSVPPFPISPQDSSPFKSEAKFTARQVLANSANVRLRVCPPPNLNDPQPKHQTSKSRDLKAPRTKAGGSTLTVYTSPMVMLSTYMLIK